MSTTSTEIKRWHNEGVALNYCYMLVVCDTFNYEDYPVYINHNENIKKRMAEYYGNMQRIMELYSLKVSFEENNEWAKSQGQRLVFNYEHAGKHSDTEQNRNGAMAEGESSCQRCNASEKFGSNVWAEQLRRIEIPNHLDSSLATGQIYRAFERLRRN